MIPILAQKNLDQFLRFIESSVSFNVFHQFELLSRENVDTGLALPC